jgi:phenylalanine ammonia-lyase
MQAEFKKEFREIVHEELLVNFGCHASPSEVESLFKQVFGAMLATLDTTTTMDAKERMAKVASSGDSIVVKHFTRPQSCGVVALSGLSDFGDSVSKRAAASLMTLRRAYLDGSRGPAPASDYLVKTRPVYEFVREKLGIGMHGLQNHESFPNGLDVEEATIGENVSLIHEVREAPDVHCPVPDFYICRLFEMDRCNGSLLACSLEQIVERGRQYVIVWKSCIP